MKNIYLACVILIATIFINVSCARETGEMKNMKGVVYYSDGGSFISKNLKTGELKEIINVDKEEIDSRHLLYLHRKNLFGFFKMTEREGYVCLYDKNGEFAQKFSGFDGSYPSLSQGEEKIAYYRHKNLLVVKNIKDGSEKIFKGFYDYAPPVWIDNNRLVYIDASLSMKLLDLESREKKDLGNNKLVPLIKYSEESVLCVAHGSKKLYLFNIKTGEGEEIYEFARCLWGYALILSPDKNFIVVSELRPSPGILDALSEKSDINIISLKDGSKRLIQKSAILDGGFWFEE